MGFELATLVVIGTACTVSCKSNYHTITTTMIPIILQVLNNSYCYHTCSEWVSKWLLLNAKWANFQLYHGENKLHTMMSTLYLISTLSGIFIMLAHWNNSPQVDMLFHSNTNSLFWANQSLLLLLKAMCLSNKYQFIVFGSNRQGFERTIYHTRDEHVNHCITPLFRLYM